EHVAGGDLRGAVDEEQLAPLGPRAQAARRPDGREESLVVDALLALDQDHLARWGRRHVDARADVGHEEELLHEVALLPQRERVAGQADDLALAGEAPGSRRRGGRG